MRTKSQNEQQIRKVDAERVQGDVVTGRALTSTEQQLFAYLGDERQAVEMAKHLTLPPHASYELIENSVAMLLVRVKEAADGGETKVQYVDGQRRDTLRRLQ
ncbi:MAG: hypothetical protein WA485_12355 [Candidatus Sulfotelmatobacter sp.]